MLRVAEPSRVRLTSEIARSFQGKFLRKSFEATLFLTFPTNGDVLFNGSYLTGLLGWKLYEWVMLRCDQAVFRMQQLLRKKGMRSSDGLWVLSNFYPERKFTLSWPLPLASCDASCYAKISLGKSQPCMVRGGADSPYFICFYKIRCNVDSSDAVALSEKFSSCNHRLAV